MKNIKFPKEVSSQKIRESFKTKGLSEFLLKSNKTKKKVNQLIYKKTLSPELKDLYRLYQFVFLNKRITALEFGSGWSSIILSLALNNLKHDQHIFYLDDPCLGKYNKLQLNFYKR